MLRILTLTLALALFTASLLSPAQAEAPSSCTSVAQMEEMCFAPTTGSHQNTAKPPCLTCTIPAIAVNAAQPQARAITVLGLMDLREAGRVVRPEDRPPRA